MLWPNFCGGFYTALSPVIAADTAINVYPETRTVPGSAKELVCYGTPGRRVWLTVGTSRCRGWFTQDGRTFVVVGPTLYEIDRVLVTATVLGTVADDGQPVSFASNGAGGDQLGVVSGGAFYVLDLTTNGFAAVALPFAGPVMIAFLDGYGLINQADSPIVWFSAIEDLTTWDALDFFTRSGTSDNIVGIAVSRDRVWTLGSKTTTLFYDSGDADTPFVPYPGTAFQTGLASPWLLGLYDDVLVWVGQSAHGALRVSMATEPQPQTISTPPIEAWLAGCTTVADGECLIYAQDGHPFFAVTCPSSPDAVQTYAFDLREQVWHARAGWDSALGVYTRWGARGTTTVGTTVYVGDYASGELSILDLETYTDNGDVLRRERTAPYLDAENQWVFVQQVELGMQAGVGLSTGQGSDPQVELQISRDGAQTWTSAGFAALGAIGGYTARAIWRRLGRARGDRLVLRVIQTDPVRCVWGPGLWLQIEAGTGQL